MQAFSDVTAIVPGKRNDLDIAVLRCADCAQKPLLSIQVGKSRLISKAFFVHLI